ncbi:32078_t:CDS:2 [Gigaspora margarita]|uniref:32078_t:CDS:1 n=1 Tax=Gigaspora margarita TaxID=4874 RepID=A0ABN7V297_GIGMA|nr:32078_t:CDS:2 [Gigaspora margarita]
MHILFTSENYSFQASNLNDHENNLIATNNSEAQPTKRQHLENNDKESICWKYFEPFKVPSENGTITKCTISGCTTRYIWCGSTSNLVGHLKKKHGIAKSSTTISSTTSIVNSINSEPEINLPLLKFIVSSGAPFSFVDHLKSAGFVNPVIELSTSNIIEDQINKAYNRLFLQLKLKAQQETSITVSIHQTITNAIFNKSYIVITCNWLTKDFEHHKILLLVNEWYSDMDEDKDFDEKSQNFVQNIIPLRANKNNYYNDLAELIRKTLKKWTKGNTFRQEIFEIIKVIKNATDNLCNVVYFLKNNEVRNVIQNMQTIFSHSTFIDIQNAEKINCDNFDCIYHKMAFIKLMEKPFIQLVNNYNSYEVALIREKGKCFKELKLDSLPFSIFPKLLQLFKPLENITCSNSNRSMEEYVDLHHFLYAMIYSKQLVLFLDPRSNSDEISTEIRKYALITCKAYYLKNIFSDDLDKSTQAANKELECYINRPQSSLDGDINP